LIDCREHGGAVPPTSTKFYGGEIVSIHAKGQVENQSMNADCKNGGSTKIIAANDDYYGDVRLAA